jgi:hypothetical protein
MVSKYCIPYLTKAENPHILMLSPPLDMKAKWFERSAAYTMAKFGMSMCVLGLSIRMNTTESCFVASLNRLLQQNLPIPDFRNAVAILLPRRRGPLPVPE